MGTPRYDRCAYANFQKIRQPPTTPQNRYHSALFVLFSLKTVAMQRFRALQCPTCRNLTGPKMLVWIIWIETMERDNVYKQQLSPKLTSMHGLFYQHFYWRRHSQTRLDLLKRLSKFTTLPINAGFSLFGTEKRQLHLVM